MSWKRLDFASKSTRERGVAGYTPRPQAARNMVSGLVAKALASAIADHADSTNASVSFIVSDMDLGHGTWARLKDGKTVAQETALKIVRYLGTSVRAVLTKYQQESR